MVSVTFRCHVCVGRSGDPFVSALSPCMFQHCQLAGNHQSGLFGPFRLFRLSAPSHTNPTCPVLNRTDPHSSAPVGLLVPHSPLRVNPCRDITLHTTRRTSTSRTSRFLGSFTAGISFTSHPESPSACISLGVLYSPQSKSPFYNRRAVHHPAPVPFHRSSFHGLSLPARCLGYLIFSWYYVSLGSPVYLYFS